MIFSFLKSAYPKFFYTNPPILKAPVFKHGEGKIAADRQTLLDNCSALCDNTRMRKMFQYRIYPTKKQVHKLNETLEECRWLYNHLLEKRKETHEHEGISLSLYQQQETFSILKQERPTLKEVHSQVLQKGRSGDESLLPALQRAC
jgi:Helix-turn-helix domain